MLRPNAKMRRKATIRKSKASPAVKGNVRKADSFREAWARIKLARGQEFFLEAVSIEESIIFDRLLAYLHRHHGFPVAPKKGHYPLGELVKELRRREPHRELRPGVSMADAISAWARERNECVHAIVRSDPGSPTKPVEEFLSLAEKAAEHGEALARAVSRMKPPSESGDKS